MADNTNMNFINEVMQHWSESTISLLTQSIEKAHLELTDDLLRSLRVVIVEAAANRLAHAQFYFRMHGRFKDMRTVYRNYSNAWHQTGFPPVEEIEEFIKKVGVEKFKYI